MTAYAIQRWDRAKVIASSRNTRSDNKTETERGHIDGKLLSTLRAILIAERTSSNASYLPQNVHEYS